MLREKKDILGLMRFYHLENPNQGCAIVDKICTRFKNFEFYELLFAQKEFICCGMRTTSVISLNGQNLEMIMKSFRFK